MVGSPLDVRLPKPSQPPYLQSGSGQKCREVSTWRWRPRVEMRRGDGAQGGSRCDATACAQRSQWGLWMRPGKGVGTMERLRGGVTGVGGLGRAAAGSEGHTQESMRNNHARAISTSWEYTTDAGAWGRPQ